MSSESGRVSPQRLAQIAARRLEALGVPVQVAEGGTRVQGVLTLPSGRLLRPGTQVPIPRASFRAEGHDALCFLEPPLAALGPVPFYDAPSLAALEARIGERLEARLNALRGHLARLQALKLQTWFEPDALTLKAALTTGAHVFELTLEPGQVWLSRLIPERGGRPLDVPREVLPLRLEEVDSPVDLELLLTQELPRVEQALRGAQAPGQAAAPRPFEALPPPSGALLLTQLAEHFGPGVQLVAGPKVEVVQEFVVHGARYRFSAVHEAATTFRGRLVGPQGEKWSDRFELTRFPGTSRLVRMVLGVPEEAPAAAPAAQAPAPQGPPAALWHSAPRPGEVWMMAVLVEGDDGREVRYVCTDVDGQPYGATRLLPREDFLRLFVQQGGGWRLLILIDTVTDTHVTYRQLDHERRPLATAKQLALSVLSGTFVPEGT